MIALGHISYANCFPIHGPLLLGDVPFGGEVVSGEPAQLNRLLATGRVQVVWAWPVLGALVGLTVVATVLIAT